MSHHLQEKTLEELHNLFDKKEDPEKLNKIMKVITEKEDILDHEFEENNYVTIEDDLYHQMGLIKLDDLECLPLEIIQQKIDKKLGKRVIDSNEIGEEITNKNNNFIQRPSVDTRFCVSPKPNPMTKINPSTVVDR